MPEKQTDLQLYERILQVSEVARMANTSPGGATGILVTRGEEPDFEGPITSEGFSLEFKNGFASHIITPFGRYEIGTFLATIPANPDMYAALAAQITLAHEPSSNSHETIPIVAIGDLTLAPEEPHMPATDSVRLRKERWFHAVKAHELQLYERIAQVDDIVRNVNRSTGEAKIVVDTSDGEPDYSKPATAQGLLLEFERGFPSRIITPFGLYEIGGFFHGALSTGRAADPALYAALGKHLTLAHQPKLGSNETISITAIGDVAIQPEEPLEADAASEDRLRPRWIRAEREYFRANGMRRRESTRQLRDKDEQFFATRDRSTVAPSGMDMRNARQVVKDLMGHAVQFFDPSDGHWHYGVVQSLNNSTANSVVLACEVTPFSREQRTAVVQLSAGAAIRKTTAEAIMGIRFSGNAQPAQRQPPSAPTRGPSGPAPARAL